MEISYRKPITYDDVKYFEFIRVEHDETHALMLFKSLQDYHTKNRYDKSVAKTTESE